MLELSNVFKVVEQRKKSRARCASGVEVEDLIKVKLDFTAGYENKVHVSKYVGSGNLSSDKSFEYVGSCPQSAFFSHYSESSPLASFKIENISEVSKDSGYLEKSLKIAISDSLKKVKLDGYSDPFSTATKLITSTLFDCIDPSDFKDSKEATVYVQKAYKLEILPVFSDAILTFKCESNIDEKIEEVLSSSLIAIGSAADSLGIDRYRIGL